MHLARKPLDVVLEGVHVVLEGVHVVLEGVHVVLEGMHVVPDGVHVVPDGVHVVPDGVHVVPDRVHVVPDRVHAIPDDVHAIPDDVHAIPDDVHAIPDDDLPVPDGMPRILGRTRRILRGACLVLCLALAACGAATGIDVPGAAADASGRDAPAVDVRDAGSRTCEQCFLPNVCVSESTTSTHSVSTPFACVATPGACDGVVSCACASQLCGGQVCFEGTTQLHRSFLTCYAP